jgi:predicted phage-related endonuclease
MLVEIRMKEHMVKTIEAKVMHEIGDAETALVDGFRISFKTVDVKGYTVQPRSSRQLRILDRRQSP